MEKETKVYLERISNLLNGQLRGAIIKKAKEENLELIQMTMVNVWNEAYNQGKKDGVNETTEDQLREELRDEIINELKKK